MDYIIYMSRFKIKISIILNKNDNKRKSNPPNSTGFFKIKLFILFSNQYSPL